MQRVSPLPERVRPCRVQSDVPELSSTAHPEHAPPVEPKSSGKGLRLLSLGT
jgi:hypothetical protein